jgi:uncharacterized protein (DUF3820 family)
MDEFRIKCKVAARELAAIYIEMMNNEVSKQTDACVVAAFWDEIRKAVPKKQWVPEPLPPIKPMSDADAKVFGNHIIGWGKWAGTRIDDIPLEYLEWVAEQTFQGSLREYLASRRIKAETL